MRVVSHQTLSDPPVWHTYDSAYLHLLPLMPTMWKLVEAVEYVDFLKVREQWAAANAP